MLELVDVSVSHAGREVLAPLTWRVPRGRTTVLIGPSGAGKSTLLKLMNGLLQPDRGAVRFDGLALERRSLPALRRRMGYVVQEGGLFPHLTVRGNVTLLARQLGWERRRLEERLDELLALTRLPRELLARHPGEISGGQRQRVSLMRALMLDPDVLLLDEPLGSLDPMIRSELQDELRAIFRTLCKTVVLVTHDLAEAAFFADLVLLLHEGRVAQEGPVRELLESPRSPFVERFIRSQRNLFQALEALDVP